MNDVEVCALLISFLAFFICTPILAYCLCTCKHRNQYENIFTTSNTI